VFKIRQLGLDHFNLSDEVFAHGGEIFSGNPEFYVLLTASNFREF